MVTYSERRRFAGEQSLTHHLEEVRNTITDLKGLILRGPIEVHGRVIRPEQTVAYLVRELTSADDLVVAVPAVWGEAQRRALVSGLSIASRRCLSLVNSTTAAAICYAMLHRGRLPPPNAAPLPVAFVDIGASNIEIAVALVRQGTVEVRGFVSSDQISGSVMTDRLAAYLQGKYQIDLSGSDRAMARFRRAVERLKQTLSANAVVRFEANDDISFLVKREEFESQIGDLLLELPELVGRLCEMVKIAKKDLFEVQIVGGSSRVPAVQAALADAFGREPMRSLDADEAVAIGCGYLAAQLSPRMRVPLVVKEVCPRAIAAAWDGQPPVGIFAPWNHVPSVMTRKVNVRMTKSISLFADGAEIGKVNVTTGVDDEVQVSLKVRLTQSGIVQVTDGYFEHANKSHLATIEGSFIGELSQADIQEFVALENEMHERDEQEQKIDEARNEFEGVLFKAEADFNGGLIDFGTWKENQEIRRELENAKLWFEEKEYDRLPVAEYAGKTKRLQDLLGVLGTRKRNCERFAELAPKICRLRKTVQALKKSDVTRRFDEFLALYDEVEDQPRQIEIPIDTLEKQLDDIEASVNTIQSEQRHSCI
jgi:molecular chaperone DnaK (HSP70)